MTQPVPEGAQELIVRVLGAVPIIAQEAMRGNPVRFVPGSDFVPKGVYHLLGTGNANNEPSLTREQRSGRCFELSCWAVVAGTVAPEGSRLVNGSIHGRTPDTERIGHGWVVLPGGLIWEPTNALIHDAAEFTHAARAWDEVSYTPKQAALNVLRFQHYGAWHDTRYPTKYDNETQEEAKERLRVHGPS